MTLLGTLQPVSLHSPNDLGIFHLCVTLRRQWAPWGRGLGCSHNHSTAPLPKRPPHPRHCLGTFHWVPQPYDIRAIIKLTPAPRPDKGQRFIDFFSELNETPIYSYPKDWCQGWFLWLEQGRVWPEASGCHGGPSENLASPGDTRELTGQGREMNRIKKCGLGWDITNNHCQEKQGFANDRKAARAWPSLPPGFEELVTWAPNDTGSGINRTWLKSWLCPWSGVKWGQ